MKELEPLKNDSRGVRLGMGMLALCTALAFLATAGWAITLSQGAHGNKSNMPKGCGSCHVGHGKKRTPMLPDSEEDLCYECHGGQSRARAAEAANRLRGNATMPDISKEFRKPFHHPVEIVGAHNPREETDPSVPILQRHSECVDCHDHHGTERKQPDLPPGAGIRKRSSYRATDFEYNLCFRCHGRGSITAPLAETTDPENEFDLSNPSYHPVEGRGRNPDVPSLIQPYTEESIINCTTCHTNDDPFGPRGPHGSIYDPILADNFQQEDDSPESEFLYRLCYKCHSRSSILADQSFSLHSKHIVDERTSCHTCHDAHGSQLNTHLIFFNREVVSPSSSGRFEFIDLGSRAGQCYLNCHNKDHDPLAYP